VESESIAYQIIMYND